MFLKMNQSLKLLKNIAIANLTHISNNGLNENELNEILLVNEQIFEDVVTLFNIMMCNFYNWDVQPKYCFIWLINCPILKVNPALFY